MDIEEAKKDLEELKRLRQLCQRGSVVNLLEERIKQLSRIVEQASVPGHLSTSSGGPLVGTTKLTNYAWDQSDKFVKIYFSIPTEETIEESNMKVEFKETGFQFEIKHLGGKNYSFSVGSLLHPVVPGDCYYRLKKNEVVIFLRKKNTGTTWDHLTTVELKAKTRAQPKFDKTDDDPGAGLMNMMRELYASGDDEMKKAIAKAWCEAQDKVSREKNAF
ncbi:Calcyclin binding protein [Trichuris trichiura]|uniref:Calcyclin binding protein n=1 Tax=Trichuris trichiura TaxID=36087 RepID=A0A077YZA1_TRITR|nr:Calcyclin binding protein [Trichuris trichiura]